MVMKIVTYVLIALLVVALGAGAFFYLNMYKPMTVENEKMKTGMRELDKAKAELKRIKDQETKATAWLKPTADAVNAVLADDIKAGKAEVLSGENSVVVNISEDALYMPGSYTFSKDSQPLLLRLETLLKNNDLKGKDFIIGNTAEAVPAKGKGKKRTPAKEARTLAAERSAALIKHLEKKGVDQNAMIEAAYSSNRPEIGSKIKGHKTVIIIRKPLAGQASAPNQGSAPAATPSSAAPAAPQAAPKAIPIQPAKPATK